MFTSKDTKNLNIEEVLAAALKKIDRKSEKDICKYLPSGSEGYYMHHFTMKKLRRNNPTEFKALIEEFILTPEKPREISFRPRMRRNKTLTLSQADIKKILGLAQKTGDKYLLNKLGSKLSLPSVKKQLIKSIKENHVEEDLWNSFVQAVESTHPTSKNVPQAEAF